MARGIDGTRCLAYEIAEQVEIVTRVEALLALCDELEGALAHIEADRARLLDALLYEAAR